MGWIHAFAIVACVMQMQPFLQRPMHPLVYYTVGVLAIEAAIPKIVDVTSPIPATSYLVYDVLIWLIVWPWHYLRPDRSESFIVLLRLIVLTHANIEHSNDALAFARGPRI